MSHPIDPRPQGVAHVDAWVFDLDNTLYPASSSLFPQMDVRMREFIAQRLGLPLDEAYALQKRYYLKYGTTLRGLMLENGLEPDSFLEYVHDIDHSVLEHCPRLDAALAALSGRKMIFTNGSEAHAIKVLDRLGLSRHFEAVFDIAAAAYVPKPDPACYISMVKRFGIDPRASAMVEDLHRNLVPAAAIGMTTLWVRYAEHPDSDVLGPDEPHLPHVHHVTDDLAAWLAAGSAR